MSNRDSWNNYIHKFLKLQTQILMNLKNFWIPLKELLKPCLNKLKDIIKIHIKFAKMQFLNHQVSN